MEHSTVYPATRYRGRQRENSDSCLHGLSLLGQHVDKSESRTLKIDFLYFKKELMNVVLGVMLYLSLVSPVVPPPGSLYSFSSCTSPFWVELETR